MAVHLESNVLSRRTVLIGGAIVLLVAASVPVVRYLRRPPPPPPPPVRLAFDAPPGTELGAGDEPLDAAISPDGRQIAFVATTRGIARLWVRRLDAQSATPIAGTDGAQMPAWKLTGQVLAFFAGNRLRQISLVDGALRDLAEVPGAAGVTWLPDGSLLFATLHGPVRRLDRGVPSDATKLRDTDRSHTFPVATGSGASFVYMATRQDGRRMLRLVENGQEHDLTDTSSHGQLIAGRVLYARDGVLLSQAIDAKTHIPTGPTTTLATMVGVSDTGRGFFAASPRLLLTAPPATRARQLVWLDEDGTIGDTEGEPGDFWQVRLSPDDEYAATTQLAPLIRTLDVWVHPVAKPGLPQQITLSIAADSDPVWSDDGTRVLFRSLQGGTANLFTHAVREANAQDELLLKSELDETPTDWRGDVVLFQAPRPGTGLDLWQYDTAAKTVEGVATTAFNESDARWSPDGSWIAYVSDESGQPDIYAEPWPGGDRVRVSTGGGSRPRWSRDGGSLFFVRNDQLMRADVQDSDEMPFATPVALFPIPGVRDFDVAHRSNRFLALRPVEGRGEATVTATMDWTGTQPQ